MTGRTSSVFAGMVLAGALGALWLPDRLAGYDEPRMVQGASAGSAWPRPGAADDEIAKFIRHMQDDPAFAQRALICEPGYARSQRLSPAQYYPIAMEAYRRSGIPWPQRAGHILDHIVPLCLGGSWDQSNLQVQTIAEAAEKDRREIAACRAYCAGEITLEAARARFARAP